MVGLTNVDMEEFRREWGEDRCTHPGYIYATRVAMDRQAHSARGLAPCRWVLTTSTWISVGREGEVTPMWVRAPDVPAILYTRVVMRGQLLLQVQFMSVGLTDVDLD